MKLRTILPLFTLLFLGFAACEKEKDDFRDAWTGNYTGTRHNQSWSLNNPVTYDTLYTYSFLVSKPVAEDSIKVNGSTVPINPDGTYYVSSSPGNYYSLRFTADSCLIEYRSGGLGGYFLTTIQAKKQ